MLLVVVLLLGRLLHCFLWFEGGEEVLERRVRSGRPENKNKTFPKKTK